MSRLDDIRKGNTVTPSSSGTRLDRLRNDQQSIDSANRMNQEDIGQQEIMSSQPSLISMDDANRMNQDDIAQQRIMQGQQQLPGRDIPVIGSVLKGLDYVASNPISSSIAEYTVPDAPFLNEPNAPNARETFLQSSGQEPATGVSKFIGQAAAPFFVPGAQLGTGTAATEAAQGVLTRFAPRLQGIGQAAAREGLAGGAIGFGSEYAQGQGDLRNAAISGAYGVGLGAAGGAAFAGVGRGLERFRNRAAITPEEIAPQVQEMLALPSPRVEGRINAALERSNLTPNESPIAPYGETPTLALPEGNYTQPQRLQVQTSVDPYLNKVMEQIKPIVTERMTPPLENPNELAKWVRDHLGADVSLNEVRSLPYEDLRQLAEEVRGGLNVADEAFKAASERGYNLNELFNGKTPNVAEKVAQDAQNRTYGVYPDQLPSVRQPEGFNISRRGQAEPPVMRTGFRRDVNTIQRSDVSPSPRPTVSNNAPVNQVDVAPFIPVENAAPQVISRLTPVQQPRGFTQTLLESEKTPQGLKNRLKAAYTQVPNEVSVSQANKRVSDDLESAASYVMGKSAMSAEKVTTAHRLIDEFSKQGNFERANDIADKIATELTKAGQSVQAASIYNRLTPEGILVHANRVAQRVNDKLPLTAKEVKVTPDMAASITDLAQTTQKMTGVKDLANDVMNILEKAKSGGTLSETEAATLRNFVNESKQFVKETTRKPSAPRPPREPKDKRVRDNVISFLDAQEKAAKERLRARGIQISSTPLDVWADQIIIGAAKMGKGAVKFADWSEAMVKDLGESIRPQLQQLYERSVETYEQSAKVVTRQTIDEAEKLTEKVIKSKELDQSSADSLRSLAQKVSGLSGEEKRVASQDLQAILQGLERPSVLKRVSSIQTMGQLLNPKTQVRNALGNELFYRVERMNKMLATPIDIIRSKVTGGERTVTFRTNNQGEYWKNWMRGLKAGWKGVNVNGLETQYDLASPAFKSKYNPLTYMEKSLGAALKSFDTAAYMRAYNNTVGELATLRATNEGKSGDKELIQKYIREADDNVMKIADEYGRYVTFQDNNLLSNGLVALKKGLNFKKDFGLGDLVLKYPKTPGAILMRALEYSPAGFLRSAAVLARPWYKKEPNTAEVTQALSRAMIGTFGLTGLGYFLMDKGIVTGSASKDKDIRDLEKSAGQGQYQVNLSALKRLVYSGFKIDDAKLKEGDSLFTYDWMQPVSMAISMGANIKKNMSEGKQKLSGLAGTAYNSVEGGIGTLTEQSVLQGLKSAAQGYPGQTVTDKIFDILSDIPASFVPTAANQVKQLTDNSRPETYSPSKLEQSFNRAQAKIPGLASKLPKQYDTLGKQKETYQDNNGFNVLFNPGFSSRYELSPEAKMVVDLINETGDETLAPRVPSKTITIEDPNDKKKNIQLKLNGDQFSRYQQLQGENTRDQLVKKYKPDASQKSRIGQMQDVLSKSSELAKKGLKKEIGVR